MVAHVTRSQICKHEDTSVLRGFLKIREITPQYRRFFVMVHNFVCNLLSEKRFQFACLCRIPKIM